MMSKEEVLKQAENIQTVFGINIYLYIGILLGLLFIVTILFIFSSSRKIKEIASMLAVFLLGIGLMSFILLSELAYEKKKEWEKEYAYPYIESLEKETLEIDKFTLGISFDSREEITESFYTNSHQEVIPVEIFYIEDGKQKVMKTEAKIEYKNELETAYLEYINLTDDFNGNIEKGIYNLTIYSPYEK